MSFQLDVKGQFGLDAADFFNAARVIVREWKNTSTSKLEELNLTRLSDRGYVKIP